MEHGLQAQLKQAEKNLRHSEELLSQESAKHQALHDEACDAPGPDRETHKSKIAVQKAFCLKRQTQVDKLQDVVAKLKDQVQEAQEVAQRATRAAESAAGARAQEVSV